MLRPQSARAASTAGYPALAKPEPWALRLITAAERQIGVTLHYDPRYTRLSYPLGDVPRERGVCTDVVIRAYRDGLGIDLQSAVHDDMRNTFQSYPKIWGLKAPDANIDHRRVPNLQTYLRHRGASLPISVRASDYRPGDLVTQQLPGNLPHIAIVSHRTNEEGSRPLVIHNIGKGARSEDSLFTFTITGHYRFEGLTPS